jgi:N5-(cytidine 5'-diphosphoramidyl)-L-glutamine hydrolase
MPNIGISCRIIECPDYEESRNCLSLDWIKLFKVLNFTPILIPNGIDNVVEYCQQLNVKGVILSGGNNVSPVIYGSSIKLTDAYLIRDRIEGQLIEYCQRSRLPLLGVCRGMFMLNAHFGGSLAHNHQGHVATRHMIYIGKESKELGRSREVNSFHNHIISDSCIGENIASLAHARDGSVEAIRYGDTQTYGIAWHPEREPFDEETIKFMRMLFSRGLS